jgi:hypothetical protein
MKIQLDQADEEHILDLTVDPDSPVYEGLPIEEKIHPVTGKVLNSLVGDPQQLQTKLWENLCHVVAGMPSNYIILTGITANWVRLQAAMVIGGRKGPVFANNGKATVLISGPRLPAPQLAALAG